MSRFLFVADSAERTSGTRSNFTIGSLGLTEIKGFMIDSVTINTLWYNVNASNKYIDADLGAGEITATLTEGNYDDASLKAEIDSKLTTLLGSPTSITFSSSTWRATISSGVVFSLLFNTGTHATSNPAKLLGFVTTADTTSATSAVGTSFYNLNPSSVIHIKCPTLTALQKNINKNGPTDSDTILSVPVDSSFGNIIHYTPSDAYNFDFSQASTISSINLSITDDNDEPLSYLQKDWIITLILKK